jgi:AraC-like DNA-binding protein
MSVQDILEICEKKNIPFKSQKILNEYFSGIPVINENSHLFIMLESLCERIWGINNFSVTDINQEWEAHASPININSSTDSEETLVNISLMEKRYNYENELIQAVSLGQTHKVDQLLTGLNELSFEKRSSDPLRNMKNYCIIMNTLFRKAAESGGVMPIYLDKVSSDFAYKIEQVSNLSNIQLLMKEIFRSYCRLVRKHSMKNYSPIVQKTIIFIESDLSSNLTLSSLAGMQNVSGGYLSSIFKKETGKTVTEYIREKRIKHAIHLLTTTHLQIQTVAADCGILDLQYFSKIFKKHTGMTPKEYRDSAKIKK